MNIYRTTRPEERLNIKYAPRRAVFRIAARGRAIHIPARSVLHIVGAAATIVLSIMLFVAGKEAAYRERGYFAIGGEYLILLLPLILYAAGRTVKDWIADFRAFFREVR